MDFSSYNKMLKKEGRALSQKMPDIAGMVRKSVDDITTHRGSLEFLCEKLRTYETMYSGINGGGLARACREYTDAIDSYLKKATESKKIAEPAVA